MTRLAIADLRLAAWFLWITPLLAALSSAWRRRALQLGGLLGVAGLGGLAEPADRGAHGRAHRLVALPALLVGLDPLDLGLDVGHANASSSSCRLTARCLACRTGGGAGAVTPGARPSMLQRPRGRRSTSGCELCNPAVASAAGHTRTASALGGEDDAPWQRRRRPAIRADDAVGGGRRRPPAGDDGAGTGRRGRCSTATSSPDRPHAGAYDEMFPPTAPSGRPTGRCTTRSRPPPPPTSRRAPRRSTGPTSTRASPSPCPARSGRSRSTSCPRVISAAEWSRLERGIVQRVQALEAFLADIYGDAADRPRRRAAPPADHQLRRTSTGPRRARSRPTACASTSPASTWSATRTGVFRVLEDNLRTPSGVSYVMENRRTMARVFPDLFTRHRVRPVDDYAAHLLRGAAGGGRAERGRPDRRRAHPRRLQLGLLRALAAGPADGRGAGRGPRPVLPRQPRLHAHHRRASSAST